MSEGSGKSGKGGLKARFSAWWEGYDLPNKRSAEATAEGDAAHSGTNGAPSDHSTDRHGRPLWTANKIEVAETLWGEGYVKPGGTDLVPEMVKALGLSPAMTMIEFGAGLGGNCRAAVEKYGCWTVALEAAPILIKEGMARSAKVGKVKQAPVERYDPEAFTYAKRADAILSCETVHTIANKAGLFEGMWDRLKPKGQVLLTDLVLTRDADLAKLEKWALAEAVPPWLWRQADAERAFTQCGFDLRIAKDVTDEYQATIVQALDGFAKMLTTRTLDTETRMNVLHEIEHWGRRVSALHAGLRLIRFHAFKIGE